MPDSRLSRPEYLGGSKSRVSISEVLSTAETEINGAVTPLGSQGGHGLSVSGSNQIKYRSYEHGYIIGITNVQPVTAYQQGIPRTFRKQTRFDYAWPSFAHIGEQEINMFELYTEGLTEEELNEVFGYIPRYSEYKYMNNQVSGRFKTTLQFWHLARDFFNKPLLNASFISCRPSTRIFADTAEGADHIYAHIYNNINVIRKLPKFGIPSL